MKYFLIKILILAVLILYTTLDRFVIVIPFILLMIFLFLLELKSLKKADIYNNTYSSRLGLFILYSCLTVFWSPNSKDAEFEIAILIMLMVVGFLLYYFINKYNNFHLILYSILGVSFINHVAGLGIPIFDFLLYNTSDRGGIDGVINGWGWKGRFSGIMQNPNSLAVFILFSLFLSIYSLDNKDKSMYLSRTMKYICFANIILCLYTIFLTQSRKGMIFGVLLVLLYASLRFSFKKVIPYLLSIVTLILMPTLIPGLTSHFEGGIERIEALLNLSNNSGGQVDNSAITRLYYIAEGWQGFLDNPIFGHGINSFRHYFGQYAHNNFIELLFSVGIIGFIIYYSIHLSILKKLIKDWKQNMFLISFLIIVISMDVGLVSYENKANLLILITLMLIIDRSEKQKIQSYRLSEKNI